MLCQAGFAQWLTTIMPHRSHLSTPQATVSALWSFGMVLARALDATPLGTRFVVRAISVVYRGGAIPVAWVILPAGAKHAWRRAWRRLRRLRRPAIPRG